MAIKAGTTEATRQIDSPQTFGLEQGASDNIILMASAS
jgi:hypothetical protein